MLHTSPDFLEAAKEVQDKEYLSHAEELREAGEGFVNFLKKRKISASTDIYHRLDCSDGKPVPVAPPLLLVVPDKSTLGKIQSCFKKVNCHYTAFKGVTFNQIIGILDKTDQTPASIAFNASKEIVTDFAKTLSGTNPRPQRPAHADPAQTL